jgi:small GTP-binding protein
MVNEEIKKNIILLGDAAVGKTSLIRRYVLDQFDERYVTTIGSKVTKKEIDIPKDGSSIKMIMLIWDIIGQKEYELTQTLSMRNIDGAVLVCDVTRAETLESLKSYWLPKILATRGQIPLVFLANKSDMVEEKIFDICDLEEAALKAGILGNTKPCCIATSAKSGANIEPAFSTLAGALLGKMNSTAGNVPIQEIIRRSEAKSLAGVVDFIIADFADQYGCLE